MKTFSWSIAIIGLVAMVVLPKPWSDVAMIVALFSGGFSIGMEYTQRRSA